MINKFIAELRKQYREQIEKYTADIALGRCASYQEYTNFCGVIRGLAMAEEFLIDHAQKVNQDDDDK